MSPSSRVLMVCLLLAASTAFAGQLHVYDTTLPLLDFALLVRVVASQKGKSAAREVRARVVRCFAKPGKTCGDAKVGAEVTFPLYGGVEWTDEHKSPIDHRYWDRARSEPKAEQLCFLLPAERAGQFEPVEHSDARLQKFEAFFGATPVAELLSPQDTPALYAVLRDKDYFAPALTVLTSRHALEPEQVTSLEVWPEFPRLLQALTEREPTTERRAFAAKVVRAAASRPRPMRLVVSTWARSALGAVPEALPLVHSFDPAVEEEREALRAWLSTVRNAFTPPQGPSLASAFAPEVLRLVPFRGRSDDYLDVMRDAVPLLSVDQRVEFIKALAAVLAHPPADAPRTSFDQALFEQILRFTEAAPEPRLFQTIATLPMGEGTPHQAHFAHVLDVAMRCGPNSETEHEALRALYERYTVRWKWPLTVPDEVEARYLATEGWGRIHGTGAQTPGLGGLIRARAAAEWKARFEAQASGWQLRVSPPMPLSWPVTAQTRIATYVFAVAASADAGAERAVSAPVGRVEYRVDTPAMLEFTALSEHLTPVGAGAPATEPTETPADWQERAHLNFLVLGSEPPQANGMRSALGQALSRWCSAHKGFAKQVFKAHEPFFRSLGTNTRAFDRLD